MRLHKSNKQQHNHLCRRGNSENPLLHGALLLHVVEFPVTGLQVPWHHQRLLGNSNAFKSDRFCCTISLRFNGCTTQWWRTMVQTKLICKEAQLVARDYFVHSSLPRSRRWCPVSMRPNSCGLSKNEPQTRGKFKMSWRCGNFLGKFLEVGHQTCSVSFRNVIMHARKRSTQER